MSLYRSRSKTRIHYLLKSKALFRDFSTALQQQLTMSRKFFQLRRERNYGFAGHFQLFWSSLVRMLKTLKEFKCTALSYQNG